MQQQPLEQIAVPIQDPEEDLQKILEAWGCWISERNEDDRYVRTYISTPHGKGVRQEVQKSALREMAESLSMSEKQVAIEVTRNLVTILFNEILRYTGERPELPEVVLGRTSEKDAERLIDETPPEPVV